MTGVTLPPPLGGLLAGPWSVVDLALLLFLGFYAVDGMRRGFIASAIGLAGIFVTLYIALQTSSLASGLIRERFPIPLVIANVAGFFLVLVIAQVVFAVLTRLLLLALAPLRLLLGPVRLLDHALGFLPGFIQGLLVAALVLTPLHLFSITGTVGQEIERSKIAALVTRGASNVAPQLQSFVEQVLGDVSLFHSRVVEPEDTIHIQAQQVMRTDPAAEMTMLGLLNQERTRRGLQPLLMDERLRTVARQHSEEMLRLGYFSHTSPNGASPSDRLMQAGVSYLLTGENLAYAPTVEIAHSGLMQSPGHRENILTAQYARVGIGVQDAGVYGRMFTQEFTG